MIDSWLTLWLLMAAASAPALQPARAGNGEGPCDGPGFRGFDFAIGSWSISTQSGRSLGSIEVRPVLDGCAIEERWHVPGRVAGRSLNVFSEDERLWRQLYADDTGVTLFLEGTVAGGAMVLHSRHSDTAEEVFRFTWAPQADGTLAQSGERCTRDGGCQGLFSNRWTRSWPKEGD